MNENTMSVVDRIQWLDTAVQMQLTTLLSGRVRVVCSRELVSKMRCGECIRPVCQRKFGKCYNEEVSLPIINDHKMHDLYAGV